MKNFVAYSGKNLTIEWFFDNNGKSLVAENFSKLSLPRKKKIFTLFRLLGDRGKIFNKEKFRNEGNKIYAIKAFQDRLLCFFFEGAKIIVTNAYEKKSSKMPAKEKDKALKFRESYIKRHKEGKYYE